MTEQKPLFVPLLGKWFDAFADGSKQWEHRLMRRQWNVDQVRVGRRVTLSRGYGRFNRLHGVIVEVQTHEACTMGDLEIYRDVSPDALMIAFRIALDCV
jgi:hypothetical protein